MFLVSWLGLIQRSKLITVMLVLLEEESQEEPKGK
jgi:hypothetical protein